MTFLAPVARCAIITWTGSSGTPEWNDPLNWDLHVLPGPLDEVLFDHSAVQVSYEVHLPPGETVVSVARLSILPAPGLRITIVLPETNISPIGFRATGEDDAVIIGEGGVFINESGCDVSSTPLAVTSAGWFRINNGGRYIHRTARSATENLVSRLSTAPGTAEGIFEFDVPVASYIISLSGRTFGTLMLSANRYTLPVTYRGSGGNVLNIRSDLQLNAGASMALGMSGDMIIGRDLLQSTFSILNLQSGESVNKVIVRRNLEIEGDLTETGTGAPLVEFGGTDLQQIRIAGHLLNGVTLRLNNPAGVFLASPLIISHRLQFAAGNLHTTDLNLLTLEAQAIFEGASASSFVDGPVKILGVLASSFPIGTGQLYAPLRTEALPTDVPMTSMTVTYIRENPSTGVGNQLDLSAGAIEHLSQVEYWKVEYEGTAERRIALPVNAESFSKDLDHTFIVHYAGDHWISDGGSITAGPVASAGFETGEILSGRPIGGTMYCTFGTDLLYPENPLPLAFINSRLERRSDGSYLMSWKFGESVSDDELFFIERLVPGDEPVIIGRVQGDQRVRNYYWDASDRATWPGPGDPMIFAEALNQDALQFRIRFRNQQGREVLSRTMTDERRRTGTNAELISMYPVPANDHVTVVLASGQAGDIQFSLIDLTGKTVRIISSFIERGNSSVTLSLSGIAPGAYLLSAMKGGSPTNSLRFLHR